MKKMLLLISFFMLSFVFSLTKTQAEMYTQEVCGFELRTPWGSDCIDDDNICYIIWIPNLPPYPQPIINVNQLIDVWMPASGTGWVNALFKDNPIPNDYTSGIEFNTNEQTVQYFDYEEFLNAIQE